MSKLNIVIDHLDKLSSIYSKLGESNRSSSFRQAKESIQNNITELPEDLNSLLSLPKVGKSTVNEIKEVIETGTSKRLDEISKTLDNLNSIEILPQSTLDELNNLGDLFK